MATKRKKLSFAKVKTAEAAIGSVLNGTEHDDRLPAADRIVLQGIVNYLETLSFQLWRDERSE